MICLSFLWSTNIQPFFYIFNRISITNALFPILARFMTDKFETHHTESRKQVSLYFKIVLFQWINTVLIWFLILPFTGVLGEGKSGLLFRIRYQFISEIVVSNFMAFLDLVSFNFRNISCASNCGSFSS